MSADKDGPVDQAGRGKKRRDRSHCIGAKLPGQVRSLGTENGGEYQKKEMMMRIAGKYGKRDGMRGTVVIIIQSNPS